MPANHVFWRFMLFYIHLLLLLQPLVPWLSIVTFSNDAKPPPEWIWCITNPTPARWVTPPWNIYMAKFAPGWEGYPVWQTGLPALAGHPTYSGKRDQIKMREYMDWRVTPPKPVTSPTWGPPPPCKQAVSLHLKLSIHKFEREQGLFTWR